MQSSPPNVAFVRNIIGPKLLAWNAILGRLALVQLSQGPDEFRWNLHENGKLSVDSMYRVLIHPETPVDDIK